MRSRDGVMKQTAYFMALQPDPGDDSRTSVEMLNMSTLDLKHTEEERRKWNQRDRKMTLHERFAPFPRKSFFIISSLPFALAPIVILSKAAEAASVGYIAGRDCYPNGLWSETHDATWRIMDSSYFFTPNLSFGSMKFTEAKVIDIAWDLLVGRGGQLLLAWVNYRVFNEWILYHMEMFLTSYKMYTAVAFQTTSLTMLGVFGKEFLAFGESNWRRFFRWLAILGMFLSTLYVLSFPTLMAAMTGYITTYTPYVENYAHNLIEFDQFLNQPIRYIIEDSYRIGNYNKPLIVVENDTALMEAVHRYVMTIEDEEFTEELNNLRTADLTHFSRVHVNKSSYWTFEGKGTNLTPPTLNITWCMNMTLEKATSTKIKDYFYTDATDNPRQGDNYSGEYLLAHGSCKPNETYQWGFSYIFLFMVSIFNFVWSCIMVGMWFDTARESRMYKSGRRPGLLRSIMDFSAVIREELGDGVDRLEEDDIRKALKDSGGALLIPKQELRMTRTGTDNSSVNRRGWRRNLTKGSTF